MCIPTLDVVMQDLDHLNFKSCKKTIVLGFCCTISKLANDLDLVDSRMKEMFR